MDPIAEELGRRGHMVTLMAPHQTTKGEIQGVRNIHLSQVLDVIQQYYVSFFVGTTSEMEFIWRFFDQVIAACNATYLEPEVASLIQNPTDPSTGRPKYDLLVADSVFNEFVLPIGHHLGVPIVYISTSFIFPIQAWNLNIPYPISYIPMGTRVQTGPMTFWQRWLNVWDSMGFAGVRHYYLFSKLENVIRGSFLPDSPSLSDLERNVSFMMSHTHPAIHPRHPLMPYSVQIACAHCKLPQKLPQEFEDFLESSGIHGTIYFSLGQQTKGTAMPKQMQRKIIKAFEQLPQKILWKFENDIENLPANVKLVKWAPQQDLLGHPKVRLFISHGGGLSTLEAAYHGCPLLGFPLSVDQLGNIASAMESGFADYLEWRTFTVNQLLEKIHHMLSNQSYQDQATKLSGLLQDHLQSPAETAAFWIEYTIRHHGASHLRSGAENVNFFQYFLLDVIGAVTVILTAILIGSYYFFKKIYRCIRSMFRKRQLATTTLSSVEVKKQKSQ